MPTHNHDAEKLFNDLVRFTSADVDGHGEAHLACPWCSSESSPKDPHCSFSVRGFKCFVCGQGASLRKLAEKLDFRPDAAYMPPSAPQKRQERRRTTVPYWMTFEGQRRLLERYESHPRRYELWAGYKPVSRQAIERQRLGVGVLPASRCKHERLIVPVFDGSMLVGLRGRQLDCDCGKWLAPGGTDISLYPLYNAGALTLGCVVWIVENPVDALMATEQSSYTGLATYSTSYWRPAWTETLKAAQPDLVIVAFDNDLPGNGGGARRAEFIRAWLADPKHKVVPPANGPKLTNLLIKAGLPAVLYDWGRAENKADIGSLIMGGAA